MPTRSAAVSRLIDWIRRQAAPRHARTQTAAQHRAQCDRAIAALEHAAAALDEHPGDGHAIDTAAARVIVAEAITAIAAELRLRIVALETVRQAARVAPYT